MNNGLKEPWKGSGTGFVILNNKDAISNIEEQIGEFVVSNTDPTSALTLLCLITGRREESNFKVWEIKPQVYLIIIRE